MTTNRPTDPPRELRLVQIDPDTYDLLVELTALARKELQDPDYDEAVMAVRVLDHAVPIMLRQMEKRMTKRLEHLTDYGRCTIDGCRSWASGGSTCRTCKQKVARCPTHGGRPVAHRDAQRCESVHRYASATPEQRAFSDKIKAGWGFWTTERMESIAREHEAGRSFPEIAKSLGRSPNSVRHQWKLYQRRLARRQAGGRS